MSAPARLARTAPPLAILRSSFSSVSWCAPVGGSSRPRYSSKAMQTSLTKAGTSAFVPSRSTNINVSQKSLIGRSLTRNGAQHGHRDGHLAPGSKSAANWQTQFFSGHNLHGWIVLRRELSLPTLAKSVGKLANSFLKPHHLP